MAYNRSVFPEKIDSFVEHSDIQSSDIANIRRYQELRLKLALSNAEQVELASLSTALATKILSPEDFNKLQDALLNLQNFFKNNVEGYIAAKQALFDQHLNSSVSEINRLKQEYQTFLTNQTNTTTANIASTVQGATQNINNAVATAQRTIDQKVIETVGYIDSTSEGAIRKDIGTLSQLNTINKSSLVYAINEVKSKSVNVVVSSTQPTGASSGTLWLMPN